MRVKGIAWINFYDSFLFHPQKKIESNVEVSKQREDNDIEKEKKIFSPFLSCFYQPTFILKLHIESEVESSAEKQ